MRGLVEGKAESRTPRHWRAAWAKGRRKRTYARGALHAHAWGVARGKEGARGLGEQPIQN
jgi:hypothetical protein